MVTRKRHVLTVLLLITIPSVFGYTRTTGISPLNNAVELLSRMFSFPALQNELVQIGFLRLSLFVLFFAAGRFSLKRTTIFEGKEGNKTAGIIAGVFAAISAFMMPEGWVIGNGGVITAIFSALIPLSLVGLVIWASFTVLNKSTPGRLIAIVLLLTLLAIITIWFDVTGATSGGSSSSSSGPVVVAPAAPEPRVPQEGDPDFMGAPNPLKTETPEKPLP